MIDLIKVNKFKACYIRPLIYRGYDALGVNPAACPVDVAIMLWEWGAYFTKEAIEEGLDVKVSTWARNAPNTMPAMAKSVANYANSQLIKMEADRRRLRRRHRTRYARQPQRRQRPEPLHRARRRHSHPAGRLSMLSGITRDSVITIARDLGFEVREQVLPREMLYVADEVFFVGTAVEVTPIKSVDRIKVGAGRRGPITEALQQRFFEIVKGDAPDTHGWLQFVDAQEPRRREPSDSPATSGRHQPIE